MQLKQEFLGIVNMFGYSVVYCSAFFLIEYLLPAQKIHTLKSRRFNLIYYLSLLLVNVVITNKIISFARESLIVEAPVQYTVGFSRSDATYVFLNLFVVDFVQYWYHRLRHANTWLQSIHAFHHSETELNVTTSHRQHFLEGFIKVFIFIIPLGLIFKFNYTEEGPPDELVGGVITLISFWGYFIHSNTRIGFGWATVLFTSPQFHRIHHSLEERHFHKNYSLFFPVIDWIFGTYYRPEKGEYPKVGLRNYVEESVAQAHLYPFKKAFRRIPK